jgi:hypothetical protein
MDYFETERIYCKRVYDFIVSTYNEKYDMQLSKGIGLTINFEENGEYSSPELIVTGESAVLTDYIIDELIKRYDLECYHITKKMDIHLPNGKMKLQTILYFGRG